MKFFPYWKRKHIVPAGFVAIFTVIGVAILVISHAASPYVSIAADQGSIAGNACEVPDADPSDGNAVQFGGSPCTSPSGTVLFDGSKVADWALNQSCDTSRTQDVSDPDGQSDSVIQFTTLDTDVAPCTPTDNPRSQLVSPNIYTPGDTYWESYEFWIPNGSPLTTASGWVALDTPAYGAPFSDTGPLGISIDNIQNDSPIANGTYLGWEANGSYVTPYSYLYTGSIPTGVWTRITWHYTMAENTSTSLYVNDQLVETANEAAVDASNVTGPDSARLMLYYEEGEFSSVTDYYKNFKIATTQSAAED